MSKIFPFVNFRELATGGIISDIPKHGSHAINSHRPFTKKIIDNVTDRVTQSFRDRAFGGEMAYETEPEKNEPLVPENMRAELLRNLVFHELCALLNSASIYAKYKKYTDETSANIMN